MANVEDENHLLVVAHLGHEVVMPIVLICFWLNLSFFVYFSLCMLFFFVFDYNPNVSFFFYPLLEFV